MKRLALVALFLFGLNSQAQAPVLNFDRLWEAQQSFAEAHNEWVKETQKIFAEADKRGQSRFSMELTEKLRSEWTRRRMAQKFQDLESALYD